MFLMKRNKEQATPKEKVEKPKVMKDYLKFSKVFKDDFFKVIIFTRFIDYDAQRILVKANETPAELANRLHKIYKELCRKNTYNVEVPVDYYVILSKDEDVSLKLYPKGKIEIYQTSLDLFNESHLS